MDLLIGGAIFIGGYVAACFTWQRVHTWIVGAENKALQLREKARALEKSVRDKIKAKV